MLPPRGLGRVRAGWLPLFLDRRQHASARRLAAVTRRSTNARAGRRGTRRSPRRIRTTSAARSTASVRSPTAPTRFPPGNLFPPGTPQTRPEIYAMGCRNPWRMSIDPKTGYRLLGRSRARRRRRRTARTARLRRDQSGEEARATSAGRTSSGTTSRIPTTTTRRRQSAPQFDPRKPINEGPNNTGLRELPPATPAMIYWPYGKPREFAEMGEGGRTACAGPVFHCRPEFEKTNGFPQGLRRLPAVLGLGAAVHQMGAARCGIEPCRASSLSPSAVVHRQQAGADRKAQAGRSPTARRCSSARSMRSSARTAASTCWTTARRGARTRTRSW